MTAFKVRMEGSVPGHERDQVIEVDAENAADALKKAQEIDIFVTASLVDEERKETR